MSVTQKQIAQELGISHQLVSFALGGGGQVAEKTRIEILATAERLGYRRNELARAIVTGKSRVIAVLMTQSSKEHQGAMLAGVLGELTARGYTAKVLHVPFEADERELCVLMQKCSEWRVDGAIALALSSEAIRCLETEMTRTRSPFVCLDSGDAQAAPVILTDDESGISAALDHLGELGHRRIALLSGARADRVSTRRPQIFEAQMQKRGWPFSPELVVWSHWFQPDIMEAAAQQILEISPRPTAILTVSDSIAMVTVRVARRQGLRLPDDLSIIGYGNSSHCAFFDPALSSIAQPFGEMGSLGAKRLLDQIEAKDDITPSTNLQSRLRETLVVRASTAPPGKP